MDGVTIIKIISALIYPAGLIVVLICLGFVGRVFFKGALKNLASGCYFLAVLCFLIFSNPIVATWLAKSLESQYPQVALRNIEEHDVAIVLGGGLRIPLPPAKHSQLTSGSDRYWYAVRLFRAGKASQVILTGGNVYQQEGYQGEAHYASQLIQEWGIPGSLILLDEDSRTTEQNRDNVARLLAQGKFESALLVTSALHMPRAYTLFKNLPIKLTPASADVIVRDSHAPEVFRWLPSASALRLSTVALHEYYGKWFTQLKAFISRS
ncbi:MAG: YdcF family protein [Acidiferrobacterales bacterium]|nr:YdcF family protein [Acidiferrobacterales bacterium]